LRVKVSLLLAFIKIKLRICVDDLFLRIIDSGELPEIKIDLLTPLILLETND
jgi:hypothetical protein